MDIASRKRLGGLTDQTDDLSENNSSVGTKLDQTEAVGLQQSLAKLLDRKGVGEVVETGELWKCLFGNIDQQKLKKEALKEIRREQMASAAEVRRDLMITA